MPESDPGRRDIVVLGASAGGVQALIDVVSRLPADLPASVFVTLHVGPTYASNLPDVLSRSGPLRATHAIHGEEFVPGRIYVAPPDNHLELRPGFLHVVRGPKENGHRPSVDVLFRSASKIYGPRVIGVVLTGYLDCGTSGLYSIKARGGIAIVQDPDEAHAPDMPRSAMTHVSVDHVVSVVNVGALISRLTREPPGPRPDAVPPALGEVEGDEPGVPTPIACPACDGSLTETNVTGLPYFRCHVGHSFSIESFAAEQAEALERALWAACRALEESAHLAGRLASSTSESLRGRFREKERTQLQQAEVIRDILLRGGTLSAAEAPLIGAPDKKDDSRV